VPDIRPSALALSEDLVVVDDGGNLNFYDIQDPALPRKVAVLDAQYSRSFAIDGRHLFVLQGGNAPELRAYDVTRPQEPLLRWAMPLGARSPGGSGEIAVDGGRIWVLQGRKLMAWRLVDLAEPPVFVGSLGVGSGARQIEASGGLAALRSALRVQVFGLGPVGARPGESEGIYRHSQLDMAAVDIDMDGQLLALASGTKGASVIALVGPGKPMERLHWPERHLAGTRGSAGVVALDDGHLIVGTGAVSKDLHLLDTRAMEHPGIAIRGRARWLKASAIDIDAGDAYLAFNGNGLMGLRPKGDDDLSITLDRGPEQSDFLGNTRSPRVIAQGGPLLTDRLAIFDAQAGVEPDPISSYVIGISTHNQTYQATAAFAREGHLAFQPWYPATVSPGHEDPPPARGFLDIVDVTALARGVSSETARLARIETGFLPEDLLASEGWLYYATRGEGIRIVDVRDPGAARILPASSRESYRSLALAGRYLLALADLDRDRIGGSARLDVFEMLEPGIPAWVGGLDIEVSEQAERPGTLGAAQIGLHLYAALANEERGALILDLSDPAHPAALGAVNPGWTIADVVLRGRELWLAADQGLVMRVNLDALEEGPVSGRAWLPVLGRGW
jgi:hypothetical protein